MGGATLDSPPQEGQGLAINGSVMMALASSKEEVLERVKTDVYATNGVWDMDKVCLTNFWMGLSRYQTNADDRI